MAIVSARCQAPLTKIDPHRTTDIIPSNAKCDKCKCVILNSGEEDTKMEKWGTTVESLRLHFRNGMVVNAYGINWIAANSGTKKQMPTHTRHPNPSAQKGN